MSKYNGPSDEPDREDRLDRQHEAIKKLMSDGQWRTLQQISENVESQGVPCPPASASAQLRHLRKPRFGGYKVEKKHIKNGLYTYRLDMSQQNDRHQNAMTKILILTQGKYSDMDIIGVCDDTGRIPPGIMQQGDVMMTWMELNEFPPIGDGESPYQVFLSPDGDHTAEVVPIGTFMEEEEWYQQSGHGYQLVIAKNEVEAIQKAVEKVQNES